MDGESIRLAWRNVSAPTMTRMFAALCGVAIAAGWALSSAGFFTADEYFYARAAEAMAEEGAFDFRQFDVEGAPALDMNFASPGGREGRLAPQYPSGYAVIAAPFFAAFGVKGLTLLNALAAIATLFVTYRIARRLGANEGESALALAILALATYWSTYAFAIWPHMLALAVVLATVERLLVGGERSARAVFATGLLCGLAQTIRIDAIVLAPVAVLYFRLFCEGQTRRLSLLFLAGLLPGLVAAAWFHFIKFGAFNPFTYDNAVASNNPSVYVLPAIVAVAALVAALAFDVRTAAPLLKRRPAPAVVGAAVLIAVVALPPFQRLLHGYWYALVDSQSYQFLDRQSGIERNEWGWLVFYGFSKKALVQSLPFLPLLLLPLVQLMRGASARGEALLFLAAGGFATLYAWNETDSGLGLNARFLLPVLPIASIFAAREIIRLKTDSALSATTMWGLALAGATGFLALRFSYAAPGPLWVPVDLYPQLALAAALAAVVVWRAARPSQANARASAIFAALSIGAAAAIGATDVLRDQSYRAFAASQAALYSARIPQDAFVLTTRPALFAQAALDGLGVAYPGTDSGRRTMQAIRAYRSAGRCAYAQGQGALDWLARETGLSPIPLGVEFRQGPLAAVGGNPASCGRP